MTKPTTSETEPREAIVDLLEQSDDSDFTNAKPDRIARISEHSHKERTNYPDPALYVWAPDLFTLTKFSADGDNYIEESAIEVIVMTLDDSTAAEYARDVVQFLSQYYNTDGSFHTIEPTELDDLRSESMPHQTDHSLLSVSVEPEAFRDAK